DGSAERWKKEGLLLILSGVTREGNLCRLQVWCVQGRQSNPFGPPCWCPLDIREHGVSTAIPSAPVCASVQTSRDSSTILFKPIYGNARPPTYGNAGPLPLIAAVQRQKQTVLA
ncbi:hypothetical protein LEMLEM_LOCUS25133, partial [Lemmus lemmus]